MAIDDVPPNPPQAMPLQPVDIEAWTEQATEALGTVTLASPTQTVHHPSVTLAIPLDDHAVPRASTRPAGSTAAPATESGYYRREEPVRRDSMKSREALLKGKEGSRRRQRWENDRLLHNPHATPPLPHDWQIHPTHPSKPVPYALAPLWDSAGLARQSAARHSASLASKASHKSVATRPCAPGIVPKELREKLKRSRGAKGLLMDLEGEVRRFVSEVGERERERERARNTAQAVDRDTEEDGGGGGVPIPASPRTPEVDSEDEEIVFIGRNGEMSDCIPPRSSTHPISTPLPPLPRPTLKLFDAPEGDGAGAFGRWLVHHIGVYYGLKTWSVTVGNPARREAYVGGDVAAGTGGGRALPRPLFALL